MTPRTLLPEPIQDWLVGHRERDLPSVALSPGVALKWLLDESLLQTEITLSRLRIPTTDFRRRLRNELDEALDTFTEQGWLADPRSFHQDPPDLDEVDVDGRPGGSVAFEHLRFASGFEPHPEDPGRERWLGYERNHTAHVWVMRHEGAPRPWLICQNGYRTGLPGMDFGAFRAHHLHHRLGLNLAFPVLPLHGPRRQGLSGDRVLFSGVMNTVQMGAQAAWDTRRLLSWLRNEQQAPAVGMFGLSLGGYVTGLLAALEPSLAVVIAGIPEPDLVRNTRRLVEPLLPPFYEQWGLSWAPLERVSRVVSPLALEPVVPRDRRYIFAGLVDRWVRPGNVKTLWEHWDRPPICWYDGGHLTFQLEPEVRRFIDDALHRADLVVPGTSSTTA